MAATMDTNHPSPASATKPMKKKQVASVSGLKVLGVITAFCAVLTMGSVGLSTFLIRGDIRTESAALFNRITEYVETNSNPKQVAAFNGHVDDKFKEIAEKFEAKFKDLESGTGNSPKGVIAGLDGRLTAAITYYPEQDRQYLMAYCGPFVVKAQQERASSARFQELVSDWGREMAIGELKNFAAACEAIDAYVSVDEVAALARLPKDLPVPTFRDNVLIASTAR